MMKIVRKRGSDGVTEVWQNNSLIGYLDNDVLFGINKKQEAVEICKIANDSEIIPEMQKWKLLNL